MRRSLSFILRMALGLWFLLASAWAHAENYSFPGNPPFLCLHFGGGSYTCFFLDSFNNDDTVSIGNPRPANVTVWGSLDIARAQLNAAGSPNDLNLGVTGSLTVGNGGLINGDVSAASFTNPGGRASIGGSLTTSGSISLGNSAQVAQCVRSSGSSTITLANGSRVGGVCCGALGACTSTCVVNNSGAAMPPLCDAPPPPAAPARFNAFDTGTGSGAVSGVIRTKVAGSAFSVAVVALNTAGTGVFTGFTGNVQVEVLDARDNSGTLDATTHCRSSWGVAAGTSPTTLGFAAADAGRKNVTLTVGDAFRDARIRVSHPDSGTATVVGCSGDNFAIRPAGFGGFAVSDATSSTAGTTRNLANSASSGGNVHKAGQPFTVRATAHSGTGATTTGYDGSPTAVLAACGGSACGGTAGTLSLGAAAATAGHLQTHTATYSEAGAFNLQLLDSSFAAVDAGDGSSDAERHITSGMLTVGRFVPDHFEVVNLVTPVLRTFGSSSCASRSFTYLGQPFGYATRPQATVLARNAAGVTTVNYPDAKFAALGITQAYTPLVSATPGLDSSGAALPSLTASGSGVGVLTAQSTDTLSLVRSTTTPVAPFDASLSLAWSVSDTSEAAVAGNGSITTPTPLSYAPLAFDAGAEFRYGQLKLGSAYGSELIALAVPLEVQHWNGSHFVTNAADQCTTIATSSLSLANYRGGLAACETAPTSANLAFSSGRAVMRLQAPGNGNAGSVDGTLQLGATLTPGAVRCSAVGPPGPAAVAANLPWLHNKSPGGTAYDQNPSARFSFGQHRSPLIHLREMY